MENGEVMGEKDGRVVWGIIRDGRV